MRRLKIPKKQTGYLVRAVAYGLLGIFCFTNLRVLWSILLIFVALTIFYIYMYIKHRHDLTFLEVLKSNLGVEAKKKKSYDDLSRKERKKAFQDYLAKVENDFADDYDYDDEEDYDDEDYITDYGSDYNGVYNESSDDDFLI